MLCRRQRRGHRRSPRRTREPRCPGRRRGHSEQGPHLGEGDPGRAAQGRRHDPGRSPRTGLPRRGRTHRTARPQGGHPRSGHRQGPQPAVEPGDPGRGQRRNRRDHPHDRPRREGVLMSEYETILTDVDSGVATITINRPKALNALNLQVLTDITDAAAAFDADDEVKAIIITGSDKAFAAGADIKEMSNLDFATAYKADWFAGWSRLTDVRKPIITAVGGFALEIGRASCRERVEIEVGGVALKTNDTRRKKVTA